MNVSLTCEISLSKKMRAIIGNSKARIVLNVNNVYSGIGCGTLTISTDEEKIIIPEDFLNKETSIILLPTEIDEEIPNVSNPVTSIFSDRDVRASQNRTGQTQKNVVDKLAVRTPPEAEEVAYAVKTKEEIVQETPDELNGEEMKSGYISNLNELLDAINKAKGKSANIDIESITDARKKALAMEEKEMAEAIDEDAWVVNTKFASMTINDLSIQLPLNTPFNLSRVSAKRLAMSKDIQNYIRNGTVKIISPEEAVEYSNIHVEHINDGLPVYDSAEDAEDNAFRKSKDVDEDPAPRKSRTMMTMDELDEPTEEERLINTTKVGQSLPSGGMTLSGGVRKTSHSVGGGIRRSVPQSSTSNGSGFKTIAKK